MKVFVTGAYGMVGRNISEQGLAGHEVLRPRHSELDLTKYSQVLEYLTAHKPDLIIHCAGRVGGIQANMKNPVEYLVENFDMGRNIVMAAREARVPRLINFGSSCMYPRDCKNPIVEESLLKGELEPTNEGYAIAKIATARLCEYISRATPEFQYKTLIPCNLYGRYDKFDADKAHMVPDVIRRIHEAHAAGESSVEMWGDGTARREYLYAGDIADFIAYAIPRFERMPLVLNLGTGVDHSVNEYYKEIADVVGYTGEFRRDLSRPVGMRQKLEDVTKLAAFGWKAPTSLRDGIEKTYEFMLSSMGSNSF